MSSPLELELAQSAPAPGGGINFILLMVAMGLLMWALLIRPQQKQQKEHKKMLSEIQKGDQVVTQGGIHGRVTGVTDEILTVEIANGVRIKLEKGSVTRRSAPKEGDKP